MRVRATQTGFYDGSRRRPGAVFVLADPKHFSLRWMVKVADDASAEPAVAQTGKAAKTGKAAPTTLKELQEDKSISGKDVGKESVI